MRCCSQHLVLCSFCLFGVFLETKGKLRIADVFVGFHDPILAKKVDHDLAAYLGLSLCGVLAGASDFVEFG